MCSHLQAETGSLPVTGMGVQSNKRVSLKEQGLSRHLSVPYCEYFIDQRKSYSLSRFKGLRNRLCFLMGRIIASHSKGYKREELVASYTFYHNFI